MPAVTLKAHYDGKRIVLDEPFELPLNSPLMITVLHAAMAQLDDSAEWTSLAGRGLGRAYSDSEPEYTVADLKPL